MKKNNLFCFIILCMFVILPSCSVSERESINTLKSNNNNIATNVSCADSSMILDLPNVHQKNEYWCWAASGEMVLKYFNKNISQCQQVEDKINQPICCVDPSTQLCTIASKPDFVRYKLESKHEQGRALTWEELKFLLSCRQSPIVYGFKANGGAVGHMSVITGFEEGSYRYLYINDPSKDDNEPTMITYEEYAAPYRGEHKEDFYDFIPKID